jgi:hypothetical protein
MTTALTTAIICTAILAAMLFLLGLNVSRMRGVTGSRARTHPSGGIGIWVQSPLGHG